MQEFFDVKHWWSKPRKAADFDDNRQITGIEVFYDLVYSAYFAHITAQFTVNMNFSSLLLHLLLFLMGWGTWLNFSLYFDLHGNDDIRSRFFVFLQMFAVIGMSIYCGNVFSTDKISFSIFYVGLELIMLYLWWYTGIADKKHSISKYYAQRMLLGIIVFVIGVYVNSEYTQIFWYVSIIIMYTTIRSSLSKADMPLLITNTGSRSDNMISKSLTQRFNRITVIIIAQILTGVITGLSGKIKIGVTANLAIVAGLTLAFCIWAIYSETISNREVKNNKNAAFFYVFLHFCFAYTVCLTAAVILDLIKKLLLGEMGHKYFSVLGYTLLVIVIIGFPFQFTLVHTVENQDRVLIFIYPIIAVILFILPLIVENWKIEVCIYIILMFSPMVVRRIFYIRYKKRQLVCHIQK
jgi:low temperature requirement protein LtrA